VLDEPLPRTTHTVELDQITELNRHLTDPRTPAPTAADLGLTDLPGAAILVRVVAEGPPEFPYLHGHFAAAAGGPATLVEDLHTEALRALSHRLGLHHRWGV
jgi:hypothetical protein